MYEFSLDEVRNVWEQTGSLIEADKVLAEMRTAAEAAKQRALSNIGSGQNSRAASVSVGNHSRSSTVPFGRSFEGPSGHSSSGTRKRRKSNLSKTIIPSSEDEEDQDEPLAGRPRVIVESASTATNSDRPQLQAQTEQPLPSKQRAETDETRRMITFHPSPPKRTSSDTLDQKKKKMLWSEEEDAIIREADPGKLRELAKLKGAKEVMKRTIELSVE